MELWDLYDRDGNKTGEVFERTHGSFLKIPDGRYHIVTDILVRHVDGTFLLTKRDMGKDVYPGFWEASAGGSAQLGEDPLESAKRELFEETGIKTDNFDLINKVYRDVSHCVVFSYLSLVDCPKDSIVLQEGETTEYKWVSAKELLEYTESDQSIATKSERYKVYFDELRKTLK